MSTPTPMQYVFDDGGRAATGAKGQVGDCAVRAAAIALQLPYAQVYTAMNLLAVNFERPGAWKRRSSKKRSSSRDGVYRDTFDRFLSQHGWTFTPTMGIGTGTKVHLAMGELPNIPRMIVRLSKHYAAVVDGQVRDTHDPCRNGTRCVYGYWSPK